MKKLFLTFFFGSVTLAATAQLSEANYRIYSVKLDKEVPLNVIAEDMINYDVLFMGEEHNDSVTHYLEKTMLSLMYDKYGDDLALSMEMFERDVQPVMNEYLNGFIKEKHFIKDARVWSNYRDYKPMVEFAKENKLDVICANAASRYANLAGRKGQEYLKKLPDASKQNFAPLPYAVATGGYYEKLTGIHQAPAGAPADTTAPAQNNMGMGNFDLVAAQSLWDATMAYSITEYRKKNKSKKIMQVNGKFHSDEGYAVAAQLKNYNAKIKRLIVSTSSDDAYPKIDWSKYKKYGDYIIITDPKVPRTYND